MIWYHDLVAPITTINTILEQIGLTQNESSVYLAFLKHKEKTAAEIARVLKMDKSSCYRAVESLVEKRLLITIPRLRGTTHSAVSPEVLKELLQTKKHELALQEDHLNNFIQKLISDNEEKRNTFIRIEKGIEAVRSAMDRALEEAIRTDKVMKDRYRKNDHHSFTDKKHTAWVTDYAARRIKAGITIKQIFNPEGVDIVPSLMKTSIKLLKEIRIMPKEMQITSDFRLAGDMTYIISFDKNNDFIVVTLFDKYLTELMRSMFDFIWERSKPVNKD